MPAEPPLKAVAEYLSPRGVSGPDLAAMEGGWARLLDPFPWDAGTAEAIWLRGNLLFGLGARLIGEPGEPIQRAGGLWALVDAARHCSEAGSRALLLQQGRTFARGLSGVIFSAAAAAAVDARRACGARLCAR